MGGGVFEGGQSAASHIDENTIHEAKELLQTLFNNSKGEQGMYDYSDPETPGVIREFFTGGVFNGATKEEMLEHVHTVIEKLKHQ